MHQNLRSMSLLLGRTKSCCPLRVELDILILLLRPALVALVLFIHYTATPPPSNYGIQWTCAQLSSPRSLKCRSAGHCSRKITSACKSLLSTKEMSPMERSPRFRTAAASFGLSVPRGLWDARSSTNYWLYTKIMEDSRMSSSRHSEKAFS